MAKLMKTTAAGTPSIISSQVGIVMVIALASLVVSSQV